MTFRIQVGTLQQQADFRAMEIATLDALRILLDYVGSETVKYLRSYTNTWRPPTTAVGSSRRAHPGGWGDVTHDLEQSYWYRLDATFDSIALVIGNSSGHAVYVENMDGFWVVSGITQPGGPVEDAIRRLLPRYIPGAQFRTG